MAPSLTTDAENSSDPAATTGIFVQLYSILYNRHFVSNIFQVDPTREKNTTIITTESSTGNGNTTTEPLNQSCFACMCTKHLNLQCGSDGRTYSNQCLFQCAKEKCPDKMTNVVIASSGKCEDVTSSGEVTTTETGNGSSSGEVTATALGNGSSSGENIKTAIGNKQ